MPEDKSVKKQKRAEFLEYAIDAWPRPWAFGQSMRLTEEEKEILKKRQLKRNKTQLEKEHDLAK